jgi:hypothetical protein
LLQLDLNMKKKLVGKFILLFQTCTILHQSECEIGLAIPKPMVMKLCIQP